MVRNGFFSWFLQLFVKALCKNTDILLKLIIYTVFFTQVLPVMKGVSHWFFHHLNKLYCIYQQCKLFNITTKLL